MLRFFAVTIVVMVSLVLADDKDLRSNVPKTVVDIGFILDSSGSLKSEYDKEKEFVTDMASLVNISPSGSHAGVITFSYEAEHSIKLNDHLSTDSFNDAVRAIPFMGYTTRIDLALKLVQSDLFTPENGGREGVTKVLVVLTDGTQTKTRGAVDPGPIAEQIRASGILVVVIGVGDGISREELDQIAGGTGKAYVVDSFDELIGEAFVDTILGSIYLPATVAPAPMCPPGVPIVTCITDPCSVSTCQSSAEATCKPNYCGECKAEWFDADGNLVDCEQKSLGWRTVGIGLSGWPKDVCPRGVPVVTCLVDPCSVSSCQSNPKATCKANYCGDCKAEWFDGDGNLVDCAKKSGGWRTLGIGMAGWPKDVCPPGVPVAMCAADPCSVSSCQSNPKATCKANYCGGCNAEWFGADGNAVDCMKKMPDLIPDKKDHAQVTQNDDRVCWRHISQSCVNDRNIVRYRGKTVDECKKLCKDHPECKAFEYGVNHRGSGKIYQAGDCQLNSGSNAKGCDGADNNLDLYVKIGCKHNVCWKKSSPACARGHNIKRVKDLSLEQCKRLCAQTPGCVAFEYGVNHGGARKHYRPRDCQLNTWTNTKGCDGKFNNLDFYVMKDCDSTCYKHISPGCVRKSNIRRVRNKSVEACKSICAVTPNCVGFEYGVNHGGARKHYRVGDCQLNTWTNTENCDGHYNNLDFYLMYDCAPGSNDEHNYKVW